MKRLLCSSLLAFLAAVLSPSTQAANILWVSDASPGAANNGVFSGPGSGYTDSAFVALLQNAGHNVNRFNSSDNQVVLLTDAEITAMNTNDLVIIGRATGSGAFQVGAGTAGGPGQGSNWNTRVTVPLICMSPYLVRTIAANRMGWFVGDVGPDDVPTPLIAPTPSSPAVDYLFGGVAMNGSTTAEAFDELIDRNTSAILGAPVTGGRVLATATFTREDNNAIVTGNMIADWPAGTVVGGGSNILAGYRMFLSGGSRESATAPNAIPFYTGRENLTRTGEDIFLRAVALALRSGVPPATDPTEPVGFTRQPANTTVLAGFPVTFSVSVTGAAPRTLQWQRDNGDGVTFTNIPGATTTFSVSSVTLGAVSLTDNNAKFRVVATNPNNSVTSDAATLTISPDTIAPTVVSAGSVDGTTIAVCFSEPLNNANSAVSDSFSYLVNGAGDNVGPVTIRPDGKSVILTLATAVSGTFTVAIAPDAGIVDYAGNVLDSATSEVTGKVLGLTLTAVGTLNPAVPTAVSCASNAVAITGGGFDFASTGDFFAFLWRDMSGDFDARVRVKSLTASDRIESVAKAILTARENTPLLTNAPAVNVFATPIYPGDDNIASSIRTVMGGGTNALGPSVTPNGMPNTWLRLTRVANTFTTYRSADGATWIKIGSSNANLAPSLMVGLGVASHRNGRSITGEFENFQVSRLAPVPTLINPAFNGGIFSASFASAPGFNYTVSYKNDLADPLWTTLTILPGTGGAVTFNDPGPVPLTRSRFYRLAVE
jgi:hypothetical protein